MVARFLPQVAPVTRLMPHNPAPKPAVIAATATLPRFERSGTVVTRSNALALQRIIGNQAVTRLLDRQKAAVKPVAVAPNVVQRVDSKEHSNNFMSLLGSTLSSVGGYKKNNPQHRQVAAMAFILDQNVYDSKLIKKAAKGDFDDLETAIDFKQQVRLNEASLDLTKDILPLLNTQSIDSISVNFYKFIENSKPGQKITKVKWGSLTDWGAATSMEANLEKGGRQDGSKAAGAPGWMMQMEERMGGPKKTLYVRGHMLNNNLGGPGLDYNMVPFPGPNASGIKNVNGTHLKEYERPVKKLYDDVKKNKVTDLVYKVNAIYPRPPRPLTGEFRTLFVQFNQLYDELVKEYRVSTKGRDDLDIENEFLSYPEIQKDLKIMGPSIPANRRDYVETRPVQMEFYKTSFMDLLTNPKLKLKERLAKRGIPENVLAASVPKNKNLSKVTFRELVGFVQSNARLWALEDERVPASINCEVTWVDNSTVIPMSRSIPVNPIVVDLPNKIEAPFADRDALETNDLED